MGPFFLLSLCQNAVICVHLTGMIDVIKFFFSVCFLATICNACAATLGLRIATKTDTTFGTLFCLVGALLLTALLFITRDTWKRREALYKGMRFFWAGAFIVNLLTVVLAVWAHMILHQPLSNPEVPELKRIFDANLLQLLILFFFTFLFTFSPIAISVRSALIAPEEPKADTAKGTSTA